MLAARLYGPRKLIVEEIEKPVINDNEILLKIKSAAICGTDVRMFQNGSGNISETNPRVLGHEFGGTIEEVGKNVEFYQKGMEIAVAPNMGCGICDKCVRGNGHMCDAYTAFGINIDGAFAEYVKIPEKAIRQGNLMVTPAGMKAEEVAINEPLSCAYNGALQCRILRSAKRSNPTSSPITGTTLPDLYRKRPAGTVWMSASRPALRRTCSASRWSSWRKAAGSISLAGFRNRVKMCRSIQI